MIDFKERLTPHRRKGLRRLPYLPVALSLAIAPATLFP
jgi:hypothetical protein